MAHLDRRFSQTSRVLVYIERLKEARSVLWNNHAFAVGEPGDYWCSWDGYEWIESRTSYIKHYRLLWQMCARGMFCETTLTSTVAQASFQVFLKGRNDPATCVGRPRDKVLEFASGASYILRQEPCPGKRILTTRHIPLYIDTRQKKLVEIT